MVLWLQVRIIPPAEESPLLWLVLLLLGTSPSAINLNTIATLYGHQPTITTVASLLALQYLTAAPLVTAWVFVYMRLIFPGE